MFKRQMLTTFVHNFGQRWSISPLVALWNVDKLSTKKQSFFKKKSKIDLWSWNDNSLQCGLYFVLPFEELCECWSYQLKFELGWQIMHPDRITFLIVYKRKWFLPSTCFLTIWWLWPECFRIPVYQDSQVPRSQILLETKTSTMIFSRPEETKNNLSAVYIIVFAWYVKVAPSLRTVLFCSAVFFYEGCKLDVCVFTYQNKCKVRVM